MVVSGPNTGGKTASMKSLGLNHILAMCGLPLFAAGAEVVFFSDIRADIGDKQSLVMDLSTFSSHMMNIKDILTTVGRRALVLFDELGTGTDPKEGAALALAVLSYLHQKGATVAVTTHFSEVKSYAFERPDAKLYAVDYGYDSLAPRYTLLEGVAGSSDPLMIAGRLGFPEEIIEQAEGIAAGMKSSKEALLEELHLMKAEAEHTKKLLEAREEDIALREGRIKEHEQSLQERLEKRELELLEESMALFQKGKRLAAEKAKASADEIDGDLATLSGKIQKLKARQKKIEGLKVGDEIYLERFSKTAKILSMDKKTVYLDMGNIKMHLPLIDLVGRKVQPEKKPEAKVTKSSGTSSRSELVLVGKRVDEALDILDKYLDDALLTGYEKVYIIHGRGSGQLRKAVQDFLRTSGRVKAYETASAAEGGNAVTIANL
jgi:DNA mismatch repair protein MutS2